jgi:L-ascorbate metabolism protein UlaG (beta-lactamase superfamily)
MAVNMEWVGHACFRIWRDGGPVIVTDPFSPTRLGLPDGPAIQGDTVVVSSLDDLAHGYPGLVHGSPEVINTLNLVRQDLRGEIDGNPLIPLGAAESPFHDSGSPKDNALYAFKVADLWVLHLGDLGYGLSPDELAVFEGKCDVLLAIVGQANTLSLGELANLIDQLQPRWIVPMHYLLWWPSKMRPLSDFLKTRPRDPLIYTRSTTVRLSSKPTGLKSPAIMVLEASADPRRSRC